MLEEAKCLVGFVGGGVDMGTPFHVIVDVHTRVCCSADVFKGVSVWLVCCLFLLLLVSSIQQGAVLRMELLEAQGLLLFADGTGVQVFLKQLL